MGMSLHLQLPSGDIRMNIKTKLILATTAVALLSTPALAFRDMGDAGGDSAFAHSGGGYSRHARSAYAFGHITRHPIRRQHRLPNSHSQR
jgi:hypothetical protein